jgi:dihydroxyacetone kinase
MNGRQLAGRLDRIAAELRLRTDEFRRLDAAVGDGDLGVTVAAATEAVRSALRGLSSQASVVDVVRTAAEEIAEANPSTMATLTAIGLLRSVDQLGDDPVSAEAAMAAGRAFVDAVQASGGAVPGDKTFLDAVVPSLDAFEESIGRGDDPGTALESAIAAAREGVERSSQLASKKGRAAWAGERGVGHPDPGAVVYVTFLQAWQAHHGDE